MAASSQPAQPERVCLILNLGAQEPRLRVNDQYLRLGQDVPEVEAQAVDDDLDLRGRRGLWFAAQRIWNRWNNGEDFQVRLSFPMAVPAVNHALGDSNAGQIEQLLLIATNVRGRPAQYQPHHPSNDDTIFAAKLLEKFIRSSSGELSHQVREIHILELTDRPHLYSVADRCIGQNNHFQNLRSFHKIYVSQSPGLPMVNQAVLRHALRAARERVVPFQIEEPDNLDTLLRGGLSKTVVSVPTVDLLYDATYEVLKKLLDRYDYRGAIDVISALPPRDQGRERGQILSLLEEARGHWTLNAIRNPNRLEQLLQRMWVTTYAVDAWVSSGEYTEAVWRGADIVDRLRYCLAGKLWGVPELATNLVVSPTALQTNAPRVFDRLSGSAQVAQMIPCHWVVGPAIETALENQLAEHQWGAWAQRLAALEPLRELRNSSVHTFQPITRREFDNVLRQCAVNNAHDLGGHLRGLIREFRQNAGMNNCQTTIPSSRRINRSAAPQGCCETPMHFDQATFRKLKQGDEDATVQFWNLVRLFAMSWGWTLGDEVHDVGMQVFTRLLERIQSCKVQWQGQPQFTAFVRTSVVNKVKGWVRVHPAAPSPEERPENPRQPEAPAAGWDWWSRDALADLLRRGRPKNLAPGPVPELIELVLAMETKPSPQERLVLRADFLVWLHYNLRPHERTSEAAGLIDMKPSRTYKPRSAGKKKVWNALTTEGARKLFKEIWGGDP